ncbi:MBG domain-containing protein [Halomonas sp. N3-2A]|uniref:MBG domain-containing protein n=1 Tax=Halomonas sp. N3-2A TaxID=2014541 RepID=UPI00406C45CF
MGGENASVLADVTTTGGSGTDAGTYTHTASGTDGNYDLTFVDGHRRGDQRYHQRRRRRRDRHPGDHRQRRQRG